MIREKSTSIPYLPTEDEIRAACRQIRSGWSPIERDFRCVGGRVAHRLLTMPLVRCGQHIAASGDGKDSAPSGCANLISSEKSS